MENLIVKKYFDTLELIYKKSRDIDDILTEHPLNAIKLINCLVELNENLNSHHIKTLTTIEEVILLFIKQYNNSEINDDFNDLRNDLNLLFSNLKEEYKSYSDIQVKVYICAEDKYDIAHSKYFEYPLHIIKTEEQLNELLSQKSNNELFYNILLTDNNLVVDNAYFDLILSYNKVAELLFEGALQLYKIYYDYNYTKNSLLKSYNEDIQNIVVGNSYALVGVEELLLKDNSVNLGLHSQDIYYTAQLVKKVISKNKNIKRCVISLSHYVLYHDLSRGNSEFSINRIERVYYPLLKDKHNSIRKNIKRIMNLNDIGPNSLINNIFNLYEIEDHFSNKIYSQDTSYYSAVKGVDRDKNFDKLDTKEKEDNGLFRAGNHNKIYKYKETKKEFSIILKELFDYLEENSIIPVPVVFPTSNYYYKNLREEYITEFKELLEGLKRDYNLDILDLRDEKYGFDDTHFIDSDHLNRSGEIKATNHINEFIEEIDSKYIPKGDYCYDEKGICMFWSLDKDKLPQENGYCRYISKADWESKGTGLLWDMVKECDINTEE